MTRIPRPLDGHGARRAILERGSATLDPVALATVVARCFLEVEAGRRPLDQLHGLLAPAVHARLRRLLRELHTRRTGSVAVSRPGPGRVRRARATTQLDGTVEVAVVVDRGARCTALAVRVEPHRGRWRVVELARPEDGWRPLRTRSGALTVDETVPDPLTG